MIPGLEKGRLCSKEAREIAEATLEQRLETASNAPTRKLPTYALVLVDPALVPPSQQKKSTLYYLVKKL